MKSRQLQILFLGLGLALVLGGVMLVSLDVVLAQGPAPQGETNIQTTLGTAFTYQGRLDDGGSPANGTYDFQFTLYNADVSGSRVGSTVTKSSVRVNDGLFTVRLDFGDVFDGTALWLEVAVRPAGSGSYTALSPRQALTAAPYARYAATVPWSGLTSVPTGLNDGDNDTLGSLSCANGEVAKWNGSIWLCSADADSGGDITAVNAGTGLVDGGISGDITLSLDTSYTDARYWKLAGNSGTNPSIDSLGTTDSVTLTLVVSSTAALRLVPDATSPNLVGGHSKNRVTGGVYGATIGGGGSSASYNRVTDDYGTVGGGAGNRAGDNSGTTSDKTYATVGGGETNTASGSYATVGGGWNNTASGLKATVAGGYINNADGSNAFVGGGYNNNIASLTQYGTIAGGYGNVVSPTAGYATIGGGYSNMASGNYASTVGGGRSNTASGSYATIAGGYSNEASGPYTFVGGGNLNAAGSSSYATVIGGYTNNATGAYATIAGGNGNSATNTGSAVGGGVSNTVSGLYAVVPGGRDAQASHYGEMAYASGNFATAGDAQSSLYVMRGTTAAGGIWYNLYLDGSSRRLTLANGRTMTFDILIVGRSTAGKSAGYRIQGVIENVGGTTTFVGSPTVSILGEDDTAWGAQVVADNTNDALSIQVQGNTGDSVGWVAVVRTAEVVY